jgi:hypothetical protein
MPIPRIVDALVPQLPGTLRHSDAEGLREALERTRRDLEGLETGVTDGDRQPRTGRVPPACTRVDMRCQPAEQFATRSSVVDTQEHVGAKVRSRPVPEDRRLDFVQVQCRRLRRGIADDGLL